MDKCPVFYTADILGKKWTIALFQEIALNGDSGFNDIFKRMKNISPKVLSIRLKEMEKQGIVEKTIFKEENQIRTQYNLTEKGKELHFIIEKIKAWDVKHSNKKLECNQIACVDCALY